MGDDFRQSRAISFAGGGSDEDRRAGESGWGFPGTWTRAKTWTRTNLPADCLWRGGGRESRGVRPLAVAAAMMGRDESRRGKATLAAGDESDEDRPDGRGSGEQVQ
jgi:hypothetical protein